MKKKLVDLLPVLAIALLPTFLIWIPFLLRLKSFWTIPLPSSGMATIVSNYDGPLFLVVAKTFYNQSLIKELFSFPLPTEYYAAHFPAYPFLIRLVSPLIGFPYAMLAVTLFTAFLALFYFNKLANLSLNQGKALFLTAVFGILPARWLIVRSVGSAEPLFLASIIASVYFFEKKRYWQAGVWGLVASLTKAPGILLFVAYLGRLIFPLAHKLATQKFSKWLTALELKKIYPLFLIPVSLFLLFVFYKIKFNDLFAYFHSGDNIHLFFPPFQVFNFSAPWVGTFWLEEIVFVYLLTGLGLVKLVKRKMNTFAFLVGVFLFSLIFVSHRDIVRYGLPVVPFLLIAFSKTLTSKEFKIVFAALIIPVYLFSLAYISQNTMPIADWAPFL